MNDLDEQLRELIPRMRRCAVSLTRNPSSADDLVQASLERALSSWGKKRPDGDLRASGCSRSSTGSSSMPTGANVGTHGCWNSSPAATTANHR